MTKSKRRVTNTATGAAAMKSIEAYTPTSQRLFDDPILARLLPAPARALTLRFIAAASSGSEVCFTYVPQEVIEGHSTRAGAETARRFVAQRTWVTGFDPATLATELGALGLDLAEDLGAADYQARYLVPRGRAPPLAHPGPSGRATSMHAD
jgi:O-methyltransferase involved in polyketide biosynthesis